MAIRLDILDRKEDERYRTTFENPYKEIVKAYEEIEKLAVLIPTEKIKPIIVPVK